MVAASSVTEKEKSILDFWDRDKTFEKSLEQTKKGPEYVFYDGPPFATGLPHYGHLLASIAKDAIPRFWTMKGHHVQRRWGWDCHGLPIENIVEQQLGIKTKDEIEKMGIKKFNEACRKSVLAYASEWGKTIRRIARWVDFERSYKTMDNSYIQSVWWAFKTLYDKGYIYKGEKILMYCPRCVTPLAKSEISMDNSYKEITDISVTVKFKLKEKDAYALAWTTTPWTLPSNLALTVHPDLEYAYIKDKSDGTTYLLAKKLISNYFRSEEEYEIEEIVKGKSLINTEYEPLFDYFKDHENSFKIIGADFVTAEEGTGIVHTAPAFGEDDYQVSKEHGIEMIQPVDEKGNFTKEVQDFAGRYVHDVNEDIVIHLKKSGKAVASRKIKHEYPFCYRCDTKLLYRALPAWFINIQKIKPKMKKLAKKITWHPAFIKEGRFKHIVETAPDWNISRNRYWASAIPIWETKTGKRLVIGSIEELKTYAKNLPKKEVDLHKDYLDDVTLEKDGEEYTRVPEVMDCWFESGSMPFAQFAYPFENKKHFESHLPAQYVIEYIAQTRTWFYYMIAVSAMLFEEIPFENVQVTGNILAADGSKMSKSKQNFTDPNKIIETYGADALRFYLMSSVFMNANDGNFLDKGVEEVYKKVVLMLYNITNFYQDYKHLKETKQPSKHAMDQWIISKTNSFIRDVSGHLNEYNTVKACVHIRNFIEDLSTWYIRNSRERFNNGDGTAKKTLHYVLDRLSKTIAPIMPFTAEMMYQSLEENTASVHLQKWPNVETKLISGELEREMSAAREITSIALRKRDQKHIGIRWPLKNLIVLGEQKIRPEIQQIILEETNVKNFEFCKDSASGVELDTNMTPELEAEGYARELSRKIQAARKNAGLKKEDHIELHIESAFNEAINTHKDFITTRVGATNITIGATKTKYDHSEEGKIKGKQYSIGIKKN